MSLQSLVKYISFLQKNIKMMRWFFSPLLFLKNRWQYFMYNGTLRFYFHYSKTLQKDKCLFKIIKKKQVEYSSTTESSVVQHLGHPLCLQLTDNGVLIFHGKKDFSHCLCTLKGDGECICWKMGRVS